MKVTFAAGASGRSYFEKFLNDLHSYKKQGQKAPLKELGVARKRLKKVLDEI